jgi:enoyl-CoA hydratase/carnithine racemase
VWAVAVRGSNKQGPFGAFCAGGDIRYFHQAALAGDASLEDFFTEEYSLNHLIQNYPKPYIAFMDGIVMGGGMGISQGAALRVVTERTLMAMPETQIGLFPDVGGGYFLSRCPGHSGEYLALTGQVLHGTDALTVGLADVCLPSDALPALWDALSNPNWSSGEALLAGLQAQVENLQGACTVQNAARPRSSTACLRCPVWEKWFSL